MSQAVGVDACPGGWVAIDLRDLRFKEALVARSFAEIRAAFPDADVVAVDIPIGLGFADNGFRERCRASSRANEIPIRTRKGVCGAGEMGVGRGEGESLRSLYACIAGGRFGFSGHRART